jgi:hypothetical protein
MLKKWLFVMLFLLLFSVNSHAFSYKGMDVKIQTAVSEVYDDNITFSEIETEEDFITRVNLGLNVISEGKKHALGLNGNIRQSFYADKQNSNNTSGNVGVTFQNELTQHDRLSISNTFSRTLEPPRIEDEFGNTTKASKKSKNTFGFLYSRELSEKTMLSMNYSNIMEKVLGGTTKDAYINGAGTEISYTADASTTYMISYAFSNRRVEDVGGTISHSISAGLKEYLTKRIYFDGRIGANFVDSIGGQHDTSELINVSLTDEIDETSSIGVSFEDTTQTMTGIDEMFDLWRMTGSYTKALYEGFNFSSSAFYGNGTAELLNYTEKLWGADISLSYKFSENMKWNMGYTYSDKKATTENQSYTRNTLTTGISANF